MLEDVPDITLAELQALLKERDLGRDSLTPCGGPSIAIGPHDV